MADPDNEIHDAADGSYQVTEDQPPQQNSPAGDDAEGQLPDGGQTREPAEGGEDAADA